MDSIKSTLRPLAGAILFGYASIGHALTIDFVNVGGVNPGSEIEAGFMAAAAYWQNTLANDVTVKINIGYRALGPGSTIGSTSVNQYTVTAKSVYNQLAANATTEMDASVIANLPTLTNNAFKMITPGYDVVSTKAGVNSNVKIYDADSSTNNKYLSVAKANLKALGIYVSPGIDANITFNTAFAFDFDPSNGISVGTVDFIAVAIHEIGHALGFTSGVDKYDYYGTRGPGSASLINMNNAVVGTVLDLFRYSNDPTNLVAGNGAVLDWTTGTSSYFSVDGGDTAYGASLLGQGGGYFSTGLYNGDGRQASHWKDNLGLGLMDPTLGYGQRGIVTALDLAAFDAIGWNPSVNLVNYGDHDYLGDNDWVFTGSITQVPEPASWAMMIAGFGLVGAAARRRRMAVAV